MGILKDIAPSIYTLFITKNRNGVKSLLVKCLNTIYSVIIASLLFYKKFTKSLISIRFKVNPYDPCIANQIVNGAQQTILFHVDDCKLSHVDASANDKLIKWLHKNYKSVFEDGSSEMKVCHGKVHTFLGMKLDFTTPGHVIVMMTNYINARWRPWRAYATQHLWTSLDHAVNEWPPHQQERR